MSDSPQDPDWVAAYKSALQRKIEGPAKVQGPGKCAVCCTGFSVIGALFLFVVAGLMRNNYRYVHIHGDLDGLSRPVTYAAFVYLAFAAISLFFWIRGSMRARAGTHTQLH